jgi:phage protein D
LSFSSARAPRLRLLVNGAVAAGAVEAEIRATSHYAADRFRVAVALAAAPVPWADGDEIEVALALSLDGGVSWTPMVEGLADRVEIDPAGGMLWLDGRDRTALLIEARTEESFANRTASEIAELLAGRHGLAADVQATTTLVGRYWQRDHDRITLDQFARAVTEWDLLVMLAGHEGFDVWVSGRTLHFRAAAARGPGMALPVAALAGLRLERALTFARDIEVVVKSWNARQQLAFSETARSGNGQGGGGQGGGGQGGGGKRAPVRYVYVAPNLAPDAARAMAERRLAEVSRHERVLSAEMPGELALAPRMTVTVPGAPAGFAGPWLVDEVERHISAAGFVQTLRARGPGVGGGG